jgi:hypothetical protein
MSDEDEPVFSVTAMRYRAIDAPGTHTSVDAIP